MPNRLAKEQSPYLLQHKDNPIDWYPWGEEAFKRAKEENKLIFLSIGYSSCHWCHVMEREVFKNEEVAKFLNNHFVNIKVDKEERPDIDNYYQEIYRVLNQAPGGWPLSIFLTPTKKPIFAATYIPLESRFNRVGFLQLVKNMVKAYQKDPQKLEKEGKEIEKFALPAPPKGVVRFDKSLAKEFVKVAKNYFDPKYGGFGSKPKFPHTSLLNTLLTIYRLEGNEEALKMVIFSLESMAKGGIRDLVDGGFCRYSVDEKWSIPHFEKMTYDNALLLESYLLAYFVTKKEFFKEVAIEIANFLREYMSKNGLFFSASDADSEGEEGKYFTFSFEEIVKKLKEDGFSQEEIEEVLKKLNISKKGNFEGKNILQGQTPFLCETTKKALKSLKEIRKNRVYPFIDKKIITSWNAMIIKSLYLLSREDIHYFEVAEEALKKLLEKMYPNEHLYHSALIDEEPNVKAFLEDYAYLASALLEAYKTTLNEEYLAKATLLARDALSEFFERGKWYFSKNELFVEAEAVDKSYPSSVAVMVEVLLSLGGLVDSKYFKFANQTIDFYSTQVAKTVIWSAKFCNEILRSLYQDKIITSSPSNLTRCRIDFLKYPFVLLKAQEEKEFSLCTPQSCFFKSKDCKEVLRRIDE